MLMGSGVIKSVMNKRGFKHRRSEDQFSIRGEYAQNLQFVYSREYQARYGLIVDLVYFSVDVLNEKLVIGLYRENPQIENGVLINATRVLALQKFSAKELGRAVDKLIPKVKDKLK
jgi:hypothetical protein